jgi:hypothetical protein
MKTNKIMKIKSIIYICLFIWVVSSGFNNHNNKSDYSCWSDYRITNNTISAGINHILILASDDIVGGQYYNEAVYISPGNYLDIPPEEFSTLRNTLSLKIIVTTAINIVSKVELYLNGTLVKTSISTSPSDKHGVTYNVPFYCSHVEFILSEL